MKKIFIGLAMVLFLAIPQNNEIYPSSHKQEDVKNLYILGGIAGVILGAYGIGLCNEQYSRCERKNIDITELETLKNLKKEEGRLSEAEKVRRAELENRVKKLLQSNKKITKKDLSRLKKSLKRKKTLWVWGMCGSGCVFLLSLISLIDMSLPKNKDKASKQGVFSKPLPPEVPDIPIPDHSPTRLSSHSSASFSPKVDYFSNDLKKEFSW